MIQVRNVPERLHRDLVKRARRRGQTLTRYIQDVLEHEVAQPPRDEVFDRIESSPRVASALTAAQLIREERAGRD